MNAKKWIKSFIIYSILCISLIAGINFILDPLKLFHKSYFFKDKLNNNMRIQAVGIIRNYQFDSIILGTSMLENTSSKEATEILNSNFNNISVSGSDFFERSFILNYVLKNKNIEKVIYSLDYSGLLFSRKGKKDYPIDNFDYLYDESYINDFKQYLNIESIKLSLKVYLSKKANFDTPNEWFSNKSHSSRFGGIDNWFEAKNNQQIKSTFIEISNTINSIKNKEVIFNENVESEIKNSKQYLENYLLKYVKEYPNTQFNLVIPPYSRIKNAINAQYRKSDFIKLKEAIHYLVEKSMDYPNLRIYGWGDKNFPSNIKLYKDLGHYHPSINSKMLIWIKENNGLLTSSNITEYLHIFEEKSLSYDLFEIEEKINEYLLETN